MWSADPRSLWDFPASMLAEFFANHGMFGLAGRPNWLTVRGGSSRYVEAITRPLGERLRLSTPVRRIDRFDDRVEVTPSGGEPERFDEVVLATHSNQALAMLSPTPAEAEVLGAIPYQENEVVLHTDRAQLPRRRRAWASWNYHLGDEAAGRTTVTYHMNRLQSLDAEQDFCVTLNRTERIDPEAVLRTLRYDHPVFTPAGLQAQRRWEEVSGVDRTHYCGAYWGYGFHEDGVASALRVCARFGALTGMSASALYEGWVRHRRHTPVEHEFRYRLFMSYLDLSELPELLDGVPLWSARRPAPAWFRRSDYLDVDHDGPVRVLTHVRTFGHLFNPVSLYYLFDGAGERVERVIAEVTNTPWGERHSYELDGLDSTVDKDFHVSPFLGMDSEYRIRMTEPGDSLGVHMESRRDGEVDFDATLSLRRRELSARPLLTYPFMTARMVLGIYAQAVRLKLKGAPYHPHPAR